MEQINKHFRGKIDNRYTVIAHLGDGGMGFVFKAIEDDLERVVALKMLHESLLSDAESLSRFQRESRLLSSLSHKNVLTFYRFGVWNEVYPFIAMEYFEGRTLKSVISNEPMQPSRVLKIALQIASAVSYLHSSGVVHRDLTSNNVMVADEPEADFVKLLDFGLAKLLTPDASEQRLTKTGILLGSVSYMSPEQASGKVADNRSDIYSFGCILFEMLTGRLPFEADNPIGLMHKHVHEPAPTIGTFMPSHSVSYGLEKIVMRCLEKMPENRFQSAQELLESLTHEGSLSPSSSRKIPRGTLSKAKIAVAVLFVFFGVFLFERVWRTHPYLTEQQNLEKVLLSVNSLSPRDAMSLLENSLNSDIMRKEKSLLKARAVSKLASLELAYGDKKKARQDAERALVLLANVARSKQNMKNAESDLQFSESVSSITQILCAVPSDKRKPPTQLILAMEELRSTFDQKHMPGIAAQLSFCQLSFVLRGKRGDTAVQSILEHLNHHLLQFNPAGSEKTQFVLDSFAKQTAVLCTKADLSELSKRHILHCMLRCVEKWLVLASSENAELLLHEILPEPRKHGQELAILSSIYGNRIDLFRHDFSSVRNKVIDNLLALQNGIHSEFVCSATVEQLISVLVSCSYDDRALPAMEKLYQRSEDLPLDMKVWIANGLAKLYMLKGQYEKANNVLSVYVLSPKFAHSLRTTMYIDYLDNLINLRQTDKAKNIFHVIALANELQLSNPFFFKESHSLVSSLKLRLALVKEDPQEARDMLTELLLDDENDHFAIIDWNSEFLQLKRLTKRQEYEKILAPIVEHRLNYLTKLAPHDLFEQLGMLFGNVRLTAGTAFAGKLAKAELKAARACGNADKIMLANAHLGDVLTEEDRGFERSADLYLSAANLSSLPPARDDLIFRILAVYVYKGDFKSAKDYLEKIQSSTLNEYRKIYIQSLKRTVSILACDSAAELAACDQHIALTKNFPLEHFTAELNVVGTKLALNKDCSADLAELNRELNQLSPMGEVAFNCAIRFAELNAVVKCREAAAHGLSLSQRELSREFLSAYYKSFVENFCGVVDRSISNSELDRAYRLQQFCQENASIYLAQRTLSNLSLKEISPPGLFKSRAFVLMANSYARMENPDKAEEFYESAYRISSYSPEYNSIIEYLQRLSKRDPRAAFPIAEQASSESANLGVARSALLTLAADLAATKKQMTLAKQYYDWSLVEDLIYDQLQNRHILIYRFAKMSIISREERNYIAAEKYSRICFSLLLREGIPNSDTWKGVIESHCLNLHLLGKDKEAQELKAKYFIN